MAASSSSWSSDVRPFFAAGRINVIDPTCLTGSPHTRQRSKQQSKNECCDYVRLVRSTDESPILGLPLAGRIAAVAALVLGSGCQAVAFLLAPTPTDSTEWLTWIANNPGRGQLSKMFDVLAMPFLIATAAVYIMLGRKRSPRLAWIAGAALGAPAAEA
jgi:hypothetical protein